MKTSLYVLSLAVLMQSCNYSAGQKDTDDSLHYYPPTPAVLSKEEFRYYYRHLNGFFDSNLLKAGFNGGILVARNGAIIYEKYQGFADLRTKDALTDSTPLHIASATKTFTSAAILKLIQENKMGLDDSISNFFPGFPYPGITVKMLLNHRSGLPNYLYFMQKDEWEKRSKELGAKQYVTNSDVLDYLFAKKPNKSFTAGKRFSYCNTNYVLLALIVEQLSGKTFPQYMKEAFFTPLQMEHTYVFDLKDTLTATPSFTNNGNYWDYDMFDGTYGDKNIYTTPRDLLKWDQALYTDHLIRKELLDSAFMAYSFERPGTHNYGLGWRLQSMPNGKKIIYHFGKWHGFNAVFARLTDEKATIIILGNRFTRSIYNAAHLSYSIFGKYGNEPPDEKEEDDAVSKKKMVAVPVNKSLTPPVKAITKANR